MKILPAIITILVFSAVTLAITGCDVNIVDKRVNPEQIDNNFKAAQFYIQKHEDRLNALEKLLAEKKPDAT